MIRGIDVSNWQQGLIPSSLDIDFCICKATEGLNFVDGFCDGFIQDCIKHGIPFGFYHFARENSAVDEARYFYENCKGYIGKGIPVLDYEVWGNNDDVTWCGIFLGEFHRLSGVWPLLYISASHCADFRGTRIPDKCGLWVAGYPEDYSSWVSPDAMPYDVSPWEFVAIWQFTSGLRLGGWSLDGDIAYMDAKAWGKYAGSAAATDKPEAKTCEQLADEVIAGKWGNGSTREVKLDAAYGVGTYQHVQAIINRKLG